MDQIERRYGVLIDYVDPEYAGPQDTDIVRAVRGTPVRKPFPIPKVRTIVLVYTEAQHGPQGIHYLSCKADTIGCSPVEAWPEGGITGLIQQVLDEFAAQGGPVFKVDKVEMPYGPRWEVFPEQVRNADGEWVHARDVLGAVLHIPQQDRTPGAMLAEICGQLTAGSGHTFGVATAPVNLFSNVHGEMGAEGVTARESLLDLMGWTLVLRLNYAPDDGKYYVNIVNLPYRPPPRPPTPQPVPARVLPPRPRPLSYWVGRARTPDGTREIQQGLAKAGFLHTQPTTEWDANAVAALRAFQAANSLQVTGKLDYWTAWKLEAYLPTFQPVEPAKPAMDMPLFFWLNQTVEGWKEIQQALIEAGFYSGPVNGRFDLKSQEALEAFQQANGISPAHGIFDYATAVKLSPFLPKAN
ncbi:MAG TPA: peptidoglycan-binding domain-containing protein [Candidatus Acidoferrales bacterium]|nr:peptidoglycan-binding domain-containing protein [Candidatus Acidoferrales bacterium]